MYRFVQFTEPLREQGIHLSILHAKGFRDFDSLRHYDLVIVQKRLASAGWVHRVRKGARRLIYDADDAIWESHTHKHSWWTQIRINHRLRRIAGAADVCTVANEVLAEALRPLARGVQIIPMALDEEEWRPATERKAGPLRIGWSGAPANLVYLAELSGALSRVQRLRPGVEIIVYCGAAPAWTTPVEAQWVPYEPGTEAEVVRSFDIGLLPLPNNSFAAGKSPIKALQYGACAVPCIASPVGASTEIVRDGITGLSATTADDWEDALLKLIDNATLRRQLGEAARQEFLKSHSRNMVQARWVSCWKELL